MVETREPSRWLQPPPASPWIVKIRPKNERRGPSVLVVEDSATDERLIQALLDRLGCRYDVVADGNAAVERAASGQYELVFMDIELPGLDGLEATKQIHSLMGERAPRIVALTSHDGGHLRDDGLAAGVDYYLAKPVRLENLRGLLLDV